MPRVELEIEPEPSPEERAAIAAGLEQVRALAAEPASRWGRSELDQELVDPENGP
jgi:hypothetical protein